METINKSTEFQYITLLFDSKSQLFLENIKAAYSQSFYKKKPAHITFCYRLYEAQTDLALVHSFLKSNTSFEVNIASPILFPKGNAIKIRGKALITLHQNMLKQFGLAVSSKDRGKYYNPHLTLQRNVTAFKAQKTHESLLEMTHEVSLKVIGLQFWKLQKADWLHQSDVYFQ